EIVGTENNFARKPAPDAINYLTQTYQMPVEKTVMIGDRPLDIDAGKNAQVKTIFYDLEQLISDVQADYTVCSVAEMQEIIEK
ncbi:HAD hydrolase-like protein, partial [Candidatus Enterococcus willemsii]